MNVRITFVSGFLFACILSGLSTKVMAIDASEDVVIAVSLPPPDIDLNNLNFGDTYAAINHPTLSASATLSPSAGFPMTHNQGAPGGARLIPLDTSAKNKLLVKILNGIPGGTMNLKIEDAATNAPYLTMVGVTTPSDATFKVDSWTFAIQPGGGTLTGFSGATGQGTITLNGSGGIEIWFGATLRTVPGPDQYSEQDYMGTLKITANY